MSQQQPRFTKRRWRRPERLLLDHEPVMRRKDLGVTEPVTLEPHLARRDSRRQIQTILGAYLALCAIEGIVLGVLVRHPYIVTVAALVFGVVYFIAAREFGDAWIAKALDTTEATGPRMVRLANSEAKDAGIPAPRVLVSPGDVPNATSFALRRRSIVCTKATEDLNEVALEALVAHEVIHLRDGDSAVAALFCVLAGSPDLVMKGGGILAVLSVPLWPVASALRLLRRVAMPADREMRADVAAAMLTRYPPGVVEALEVCGGPSTGLRILDAFWFVRRDGDTAPASERALLISEM